MGKSYRRRHFVIDFDPENDHRSLKKENFQNCEKHGNNLIVKRGSKIETYKKCGNSDCDEDIVYKLSSRKHEKNKMLTFAIMQIEY